MAEILAIDDEKGITELIKNILKLDGHNVITYNSAVKVNIEDISKFDLILLDIMMPGMDGLDFCIRIKDRMAVPVIFITGKLDEDPDSVRQKAGADDCISKPFSVSGLREVVAYHLQKRRKD